MIHLVSALLILFAGTASAAPKKFILSASGGISLGAYQAGQLYYQSLILKENTNFATPAIVTGASAGAINSFLSILDKCGTEQTLPENSSFWKTWQNIGLKKLIPEKDEKHTNSLFSSRPLEETALRLEKIWNKGLSANCETILGVPVTLKNPDTFILANGLSVQRQSIPFILKITGRGMGRSPKIENFDIAETASLRARLYLTGEPREDFLTLKKLLLASAAFPLAFPAQKLPVCMKEGPCTQKTSEVREFVDGGIYENQPLNLGVLISATYLRSERNTTHYRHVDADGKVYPQWIPEKNKESGFMTDGFDMLEKFISTSRNKELFSLIVRHPEISKQISNSVSFYPRASDPWGAFFGFFDEGFREFDFLLGIYESKRDFKKLLPEVRKLRGDESIHLPTQSTSGKPAERASWTRFRCLSSFLENQINSKDGCERPEFDGLRILAQTSLARLYALCHQKEIDPKEWTACSALDPFKNEIPKVDPKFDSTEIMPEADEDDGSYMMRVLQALNYPFDTNEFDKRKSPGAQLRKKLGLVINRLADQQPSTEKGMIRRGGKIILDYYLYEPADNRAYIQFGELSSLGLQTNYPFASILPSGLKMDFSVDFYRPSEITKHLNSQTTVTPSLGLVYDLDFINTPTWQYHVSLSYGPTFARDKENCIQSGATNSNLICDGTTVRPSITVAFLDLVRLSWIGRASVSGRTKNHYDNQLGVGFQHSF